MNTILLPSGRATSRLGFGGTVLKGGLSKDENLNNLANAFEVGIRHYDVAPSYGFGVAEGILGEFIADKRSEVTVTTKVGLPRPKNPGALSKLRSVVRPFVSFAPALRRFLGRSVQRMSGSAKTHFEIGHVRSSVEESFREMRTDYFDILLLHEITPAEVTDELRTYLEDLVTKGMVLTYGIGSYRHEAEATVHACPELASVMQTSWTVGDAPLDLAPHTPFTITHGAVRPMAKLQEWLSTRSGRLQSISDEIHVDIHDPVELAKLMMAAAIASNEDGIVLVSSTKPSRIKEHAEISTNQKLIAQGRLFNDIVMREKGDG